MLGSRAILIEEVDRIGNAASCESPVKEIESKSNFMAAQPLLGRELQDGENFELVCVPRRCVEIIAAPTLRINCHLGGTLPVGVGVEICIADNRSQNHSGIELVGIRKSR